MTEIDAHLAASLARRFRIVRRLGEGGMGTVFLAEQIGVGNRPVALKVLLRSLLDNPDFLRRFQEEAASTGRIRHPNVVTIYESGQADDGTPYIAMEFLEGESLRQALQRRGQLPVPEVAEILQQAARGLNAAHKLGIIHRDLKPDNIFLTYPDDLVGEGSALPRVLVGEGSALPRVLVGEGSALPPAGQSPSPGVSPREPGGLPYGEGSALPPTGRSPSPGVSPREPGGLPYGEGSALPPAGRSPSPGVSPREPGGLPYQVKLVDFGIAKLRESATHTQTGMVLGTPAYMSYEQASGMRSDELDRRSDIYSLGVVVYEMLTGRVPFQSDTPAGYLRKHLQDAPPPLRAVKPDLPALPQLENVVMKALTKDRDQRYGSVLEFARDLTSAAQPSLVAQSPATIPTTRTVAPPALAKPPHLPVVAESPSRVKFVVLGLVLLAVIAAGLWYFSRSAEQPPAHVTNPSSGATVPVGQEPRLRVPPIPAPPAGTVWVNPKDGLKYVWIPPGTFMMGCSSGESDCNPDERPSHHVTISKGFWLGQTPVTVAAYTQFARVTGRAMPYNPGPDDQAKPFEADWDDAVAYCAWAGGRLPTEAEWEYAARAGSTQARYGPIDDIAWYRDNSGRKPLGDMWNWSVDPLKRSKRLEENGNRVHDVAQKRPNAFNLYDMLGNVWEWVNDYYAEDYYASSPEQDPQGPGTGQLRVIRGGGWRDDPGNVTVWARGRIQPSIILNGFRCLKELGSP